MACLLFSLETIFKLSRFGNHHMEECFSDCWVCAGFWNVSSMHKGLLAFDAFLPGYVFDSCSGISFPSH